MLFLFFVYIPKMLFDAVLNRVDFLDNYFTYITYCFFIGITLTIISITVIYFVCKLLLLIWNGLLRTKRIGNFLKKELEPILHNLDWGIFLLIFIASDIVIEYWQELNPLVFTFSNKRIDFIVPIVKLFNPNMFIDYNMEQLINVLNLHIITLIMFSLVPIVVLIIRHIKTGDSFYISYTFRLGRWKLGIILTSICVLISIPLIYFSFNLLQDEIIQYFPAGRVIQAILPLQGGKTEINQTYLILYGIGTFFYVFSTEYFFRGYLYFELERKIGSYAIIGTFIPFVLYCFHLSPALIVWVMFASLILALISRLTRTFVWSALLHFIFIFTVDIVSITHQSNLTELY